MQLSLAYLDASAIEEVLVACNAKCSTPSARRRRSTLDGTAFHTPT
jgi:hypothetical protein